MNLCSYNHDEICYDQKRCPVCELITDFDRQIEDLDGKVKDLEERLQEALADAQ